jgi:hypothetical protein
MESTVLPPPLCPPRRAGGDRTSSGRALRVSLNPACVSMPPAAAAAAPSSSRAAARTPPARAMRTSLNPTCVSRPSVTAAAAAKKPKQPESPGGVDAPTKRPRVAVDAKENKNAATARKVRIVLRPCGLFDDEAPKQQRGNSNTTTRIRGPAAADHAGASAASSRVPLAKRKVTPPDSEVAVPRPCSNGDRASRSPLGNTTARLCIGVSAGGHAAPAPVAKRKATSSNSKIAVLQPCSRGEGEPRPPPGNTQRVRIGATANGHAAPAPAPSDSKPALLRPYSGGKGASRSPHGNTARLRVVAAGGGSQATPAPAAKRKAAPPSDSSEPAKRRASPATASAPNASPSRRSLENGGTVRTAIKAVLRRELERARAQARRELERVVRTVEFNDTSISPQDVLR